MSAARHRFCLLLVSILFSGGLIGQEPAPVLAATQPEAVEHRLQVELDPAAQALKVTDQIMLPDGYRGSQIVFTLNANLTIDSSSLPLQQSSGIVEARELAASTAAEVAESRRYAVTIPAGGPASLTLSYTGQINELAEQSSREYAQSFAASSGIISETGVFLSGASLWIPRFADELITADLTVEFAAGHESWTAVSQGRVAEPSTASGIRWVETQAQEELYLIAAEFTVYEQQAGDTLAQAYLRTPDANLANRYLEATGRYLSMYEDLLGDYPYSKFALVENFWETGYGMPSFTLLGERVIRLPFILESSYPHEILHNWWGNGVYPDYESGNWSEGITAYLADHLFREIDGAGPGYRKEMLARYRNYVADGQDFPLSAFTARNSAASQAVGYGKTLMLWHMLRVELGDELFVAGLRQFYRDYRFRRASWDDIERLFSSLSGRDLNAFFSQWVDRVGAPELSVSVDAVAGNQARIMFAQVQPDAAYDMTVPVALYYEGEGEPRIYEVALSQKLEGVMAEDFSRLQAILVDPFFDVFRRLDREETPPTVGELFGAQRLSFVLPETDRSRWRQLAEAFSAGIESEVLLVEDLDELPDDRSVWILGQNNPFRTVVASATERYGALFSESGVDLAGNPTDFSDRSTVAVGRHPGNPDLAVGWIHVDDMVALPGLIEKLPHYGRYSYLSFTGSEPSNDLSGIWNSPESPMQWVNPNLAGRFEFADLPSGPPLTTLPPKYLPQRLMGHVQLLTAPRMMGRGLGTEGLRHSAAYLTEQFQVAGLEPLGTGFQQRWTESVASLGEVELLNVIGMIPGNNPELAGQPLIVGAHYDHLGRDPATGQYTPGADDNASGVSVLLEVARELSRSLTAERPVLFVAFSGEESGLLGSSHFVAEPPGGFASEDFYAMLNLDSVGRLNGQPLQVFGSDSAYEWPFMAQGIGFTIGLRASFPELTIASSDHVPFLNAGVPAIHLFSGVHEDYHRSTDTADKLDAQGLSDVARWLEEAVVYLASRTEPLRVQLAGAAPIQVSGQSGARAASLGTVPDFAHAGSGVRLSGVTPNSAAADAGLQAGDILLRFNAVELTDLQTYSNLLRAARPGETVTLELSRDGRLLKIEATLRAR